MKPMARILFAAAFSLLALPAFAQTPPNWQAIAVALRNQRDQANDMLAEQQVAAAVHLQTANSKIAWWAKCVADPVCVSWVNGSAK